MLTLLWPSKLKSKKISSSNFLVVEFILSLSVFLYLICNSLVERFIGDLHLIRSGFNIVSDGDMWTVVLINPCVWNVAPSGRYSNGEAYSQTLPTHFQRAQSHRFSLVEITVSTFNCFLCQSSKRLVFSFYKISIWPFIDSFYKYLFNSKISVSNCCTQFHKINQFMFRIG